MKNNFTTALFAALLVLSAFWSGCKKNESFSDILSNSIKSAPKSTDSTTLTLQTLNPNTTAASPMVLQGISNQVINLLDIAGGNSACISLNNCKNITIQNCVLHNSTQDAITMTDCTNITIVNCAISHVGTGVYAFNSTAVNVNDNQFLDMKGPYPGGNFVQFDHVYGAGNAITGNKCENIAGQSAPLDEISMYASNGTADSPIQITGNWLRGGGPSNGSAGIQLGDNGGSYQVAQNNILVNPGSVGIAISSGHNIQVLSNTIYGKKQSISNVGIDVWNEYNANCSINTVSGNLVKWTDADNDENDYWDGSNCGAVVGIKENTWDAAINETILPATIITKLVQ